MSVTPNSLFKQPTEISEATFVHELKKKGALNSPLFEGEANPEETARKIYRLIVDKGHSAAIFLGICGREHTWGTNANSVLHRGKTRSWTNARTVVHPQIVAEKYTDPVRGSDYVRYQSVMDSVRDGIYRIEDPNYHYAGKRTIAEVMSVWAPKDDSNDPEGYAWWIANYVNGLRSRETPVLPRGDFPHIPFIPADLRHYTPGRAGHDWARLGVGHHTDGWDSLYWLTESPNSNVSATLLLNNDGTPRAQLVLLKDTPHTTGDVNPYSWSFEWERRWTGTLEQHHIPHATYLNIGHVVADVIRTERRRGNPHFVEFELGKLKDHNDFYSTTCPGNLDIKTVWEIADEELRRGIPDRPDMRIFPETGKVVMLGFLGFWTQLELYNDSLPYRALGLPLTNEGDAILRDGSRHRVQFFERAVLIWNRDDPDPWHVTTMHREMVDQIVMFDEDSISQLELAA